MLLLRTFELSFALSYYYLLLLKLLEGVSQQPHIPAVSTQVCTSTAKFLKKGWALKRPKEERDLTPTKKSYLDEKFSLGQETGNKADPRKVAQDLRYAKRENRDCRFKYNEFLTPQQNRSCFFRKAAKVKHGEKLVLAIDDKAVEQESAYLPTRLQRIKSCPD